MRRALRLLVVNAWVTIPALGFAGGGIAVTLAAVWWGWTPPMKDGWRLWWPVAITPGLLPAGLLVQVGLGEIAGWRQQGGGRPLAFAGLLALRLAITLLRLAGGLLALAIVAEGMVGVPGLGTRLQSAFETKDFPVALGALWAMAIIVALAKLAADLLQIGESLLARRPGLAERAGTAPRRANTPGWLWLAPAALILLVPLVLGAGAAAFAPFAYNEAHYTVTGENL